MLADIQPEKAYQLMGMPSGLTIIFKEPLPHTLILSGGPGRAHRFKTLRN
jgi:hypothetical protein